MQSSPSEPLWLPLEEVIETNRDLVEITGEPHALRDAGLLDSACAVPRQRWSYGGEEDLTALAVSLLFAIARNHPFVQGNKRTGFLAAMQFLEMNGWLAVSPDTGRLADLIVAALTGVGDEDEVTAYLQTIITQARDEP